MQRSSFSRTGHDRPQARADDVGKPERHNTARALAIRDEAFGAPQEVLADRFGRLLDAGTAYMTGARIVDNRDVPSVVDRPSAEVGLLSVQPVARVESSELFEH